MSSSRRTDPTAALQDRVTPRTRWFARRPRTVRATLIIGVLSAVTVVCTGIVVTTEVALSRYLVDQVDNQLETVRNRVNSWGDRDLPRPNEVPTAGTSAADPRATEPSTTEPSTDQPTAGGDRGPWPFDPAEGAMFGDPPESCTNAPTSRTGPPLGLFQPGNSLGTLAAWVVDGKVTTAGILTGPQLCEEPAADALTELVTLDPHTGPITIEVEGHGEYRVVAAALPGGEIAITGLPLVGVRATQLQLGVIMALVSIAGLALAGLLVFLILRRSLRPLERVAATARQVSGIPLHQGEVDLGIRVPDADTDSRNEVGQVGLALNQMLGHVSSALTARQESETRVRRFVADASHELRTPLAAIRGYTELARRDEADQPTISHALRRVDSESARMSTLVDDLLLLARLDSGRPLSREQVDLTLLVMDVVGDARAAGPEHLWKLDLPEEPVEISGDQQRLHQVLANLLTNARVHTPPGTTVTTRLRSDATGTTLVVDDDGPGISPELLPDVFGRFVRGDSSRSRQAGSSGLGLSIVKAVVTALEGQVAVTSRPGATEFRVSFGPTPSS